MKAEKVEVLNEEEHAALSELGKALKKLLGKRYPYGPLGGILMIMFHDLAILHSSVDTLEEALQKMYEQVDIKSAQDKIHEIRARRKVLHIKRMGDTLGQVAEMPIEYRDELPPESFIKAD